MIVLIKLYDVNVQGFLCPMCMKGYSTPTALQIHFEAEHGDNPTNESVSEVNNTSSNENDVSMGDLWR